VRPGASKARACTDHGGPLLEPPRSPLAPLRVLTHPLLYAGDHVPSGQHETPQQRETGGQHILHRRDYFAGNRDLPCGVRGHRRRVGRRLWPKVRGATAAPQGALRGALRCLCSCRPHASLGQSRDQPALDYDDDPTKIFNYDKITDLFSNIHVPAGEKYLIGAFREPF